MSNTKNRLQYFPISLFASVMGVSGLSIAYQRYSHVIAIPKEIGLSLLALASILFISISLIYATKFLQHRAEVIAEFNHPIRSNFFPAISISLLLLSIAFLDIHTLLSQWLWSTGALLHLTFSLLIISRWITRNYEITHSNPAWFIPIVGNLLVPIAGVQFVHREISWFFFSIGLFFWVALFIIVFYRIIFNHQLAQKFIPTLFILIAPPAIGFISYCKLTGETDHFARFLLYIALFFTALLTSMFRYFSSVPFFVSWWAYTFPLCAVTIASILAFSQLKIAFFAWIATALLLAATIIVTIVTFKTFIAIKQKTLCEPEA